MPSPHHSDGERVEECWPVLTMARYDQGSRGASFDLAPVGAVIVPGEEN